MPKIQKSTQKICPPKNVFISGIYTEHRPSQCNHILEGKPIHRRSEKAFEGKETTKILMNDGIREIVVPSRKPINYPAVVHTNELSRLKKQAYVMTAKEKKTLIDEAEEQKNRMITECEIRKIHLNKVQKHQKKHDSELAEIENDQKERTEHLLQKALQLRQEQEDEIKKANRLILATKCHAIRDAQVAEKGQMKIEIENEEKRLEFMMLQKNKEELYKDMKRQEAEKIKNAKYVSEVQQQIQEKEVQRLFEMEKIEEEARTINRAMVQLQLDEAEAERSRKEKQQNIRDELNRANKQILQFHQIEKEEERIGDLRIQEFMRKKAERTAAYEEEQRQIEQAKEREIARLRNLQQRAADLQAQTDEMNAARIQEEVERKWRRDEKAAALRRKENLEKLKQDREKQIEDLRKLQALEIAREENEFHKVIQVQKNLYQKELDIKAQRTAAALQHRKEILKQINEKEKERIVSRKQKFEEGLAIRMEMENYDKMIHNVKARKIKELKDNKVPDCYINDVSRQLKININ